MTHLPLNLLTLTLPLALTACAIPKSLGDNPDEDSSGSTADTSSATEPTSESTTEPTDESTTEPTTEPTTTETTTDPTGGSPVGCERREGDGDVAWYLRCGGPTSEGVRGVAVDAAGNIYVGIDLWTGVGIAPFLIGEFEIVPGDRADTVIAKFDSAGEVLWVKHLTGLDDQVLHTMHSCADGIVLSGSAPAGTLDLGGGVIADDNYIVSLDGDGAHRWSRGVPILVEDGHLTVFDMACDAEGSMAFTGEYRGGVDLGGGPVMAEELYDGIVARYDPAGELLWSRSFGNIGGNFARGRSIAYGPDGEIAIAASFDETVDLGGGPLEVMEEDDVLIAKFDGAGEHVWSQQISGPSVQHGTSVAIDGAGRIAVGGSFLVGITIGPDSYVNTFPDANEEVDGTLYDSFIAQFDATGALLSSLHVGSKPDDEIYDLHFDAEGVLVMSGHTADKFTLRAHVDGEPGWTWSTPQLTYTSTELTDGAIIVAGSAGGPVDLGAGELAPRGSDDLILAKVRR